LAFIEATKQSKASHGEAALMLTASLILPFALPEKSRKKEFTPSMELASILCLAEATHRKHGMVGFVLEEVSFISKLHYPLWAVPWENGCLLVDGLQILSSTLTYMVLPNMELFLNDIERGQTFREQFRDALDKHAQTFATFSEEAPIPMNALVTDKVLLSGVSEYIEETLALRAEVIGSITLIPPNLDADAADERAKRVFDLYERLQSDIKGLEHAVRLLTETMQFHQQKILSEIELANETFKLQIDEIKPRVDKKVGLLLKERDKQIERMNRTTETELNAKLREQERRLSELKRLEFSRTEYKRRLEIRRGGHDRVGVARLEHSLRIRENKISEVKERIHNLTRYIDKIRQQNHEDINKLKYNYQTLIDRESKQVTDIEASLESVVQTKNNESQKLQQLTTRIVNLIQQLMDQKRLQAAELKNLTIPWKSEQIALIAAPFYLVGYRSKEKFHYSVYPPLRVMSSEGLVKKIEKTLLSFRLSSRIKLLLQPRSKALSKVFNIDFEEKMKIDKTLEEKLRELGMSNNLMKNAGFQKAIAEGVKELKGEGWIKQEEGTNLIKTYS